jgi:hypothetical protein
MPKVEKPTSRMRKYAGKQLQKKIAKNDGHSTSPTPPPSPGAEKRAQEEFLQRHKALAARIDVEKGQVQAALEKLEKVKEENAAALAELSFLGEDTVDKTLKQAFFIDSSSDSEESESAESGSDKESEE